MNKPVNLKKAFLKWYVKSNSHFVSNKLVNLFLYAPISKFTTFVRMKNSINNKKIVKIRK
jgi:hypothetical protein